MNITSNKSVSTYAYVVFPRCFLTDMRPYSRDPRAIFREFRSVPGKCGRRSSVLRDVVLMVCVGEAVPGDSFHEARVDWATGRIELFEDETGVIGDMPAVVGEDALPPGKSRHHSEYAQVSLGCKACSGLAP
jgi:hypothetical protein